MTIKNTPSKYSDNFYLNMGMDVYKIRETADAYTEEQKFKSVSYLSGQLTWLQYAETTLESVSKIQCTKIDLPQGSEMALSNIIMDAKRLLESIAFERNNVSQKFHEVMALSYKPNNKPKGE
jgi:hypothetical protein